MKNNENLVQNWNRANKLTCREKNKYILVSKLFNENLINLEDINFEL